jgi:hypothetical protein
MANLAVAPCWLMIIYRGLYYPTIFFIGDYLHIYIYIYLYLQYIYMYTSYTYIRTYIVHTMQCNATQRNAMQCNAMQYIQYNTNTHIQIHIQIHIQYKYKYNKITNTILYNTIHTHIHNHHPDLTICFQEVCHGFPANSMQFLGWSQVSNDKGKSKERKDSWWLMAELRNSMVWTDLGKSPEKWLNSMVYGRYNYS